MLIPDIPERATPKRVAFLFLGLLFILSGPSCKHTDDFGGSREAVTHWATARGFSPSFFHTRYFTIFALTRKSIYTRSLTIYIEGDGAPWRKPWMPPLDPTPLQPVALAMATNDPSDVVVYLGRPCQYLDPADLKTCDAQLWQQERFSQKVVDAYLDIIAQLKQRHGIIDIRIVGYSGGGILAAHIASRREAVHSWITVASPLSLHTWTDMHDISPFSPENDPALLNVDIPPGLHFAGADDPVVPPAIIKSFAQKKGGHVVVAPGFGHTCCWSRDWLSLLKQQGVYP